MSDPRISSVSDTARWVAMYRAWESERADALFRDPFAARLAGHRGAAMTRLAPREVRSGWPIIIRTKLFDEMILSAVAAGCDCVVNLGAGLDARPYRLPLPNSLTWMEVDFPALIEEKEALLTDASPSCAVVREKIDLDNRSSRLSLFNRVQDQFKKIIVISEGVLVYLDDDSIRTLARELVSQPAIRVWLIDFFSPNVLRMMTRGVGRSLEKAPFRFAPENGVGFFERLGWNVEDTRSIFREASRLRRAPWRVSLAQLLPEPNLRNFGQARWAGVVRLGNPTCRPTPV
jgi:methyltransferase (TIGR00027 family)